MKHVVVQGLGFVGAVLATVIASLKKKNICIQSQVWNKITLRG